MLVKLPTTFIALFSVKVLELELWYAKYSTSLLAEALYSKLAFE